MTSQDGTITTLDPRTGAADGGPIAIADDVDDVFISADAVWAVSLYGKTLARIDPTTRRVAATQRTPGEASGVLAAAGSIWVSNYDLGTVTRFDPSTLALVKTYRVGTQPRGLAAAGGSVWVANQRSNSVSRITP